MRPELLVAASVPVLLVAAVLPWQRDLICARAGCGTVSASAWSGSPVWALVVLAALVAAGAWVLALPTQARVSRPVAALTGVVGVAGAVLVLVSLLALVTNRAGFFGFDLPVTETFPVLAVHPGPGLAVAVLGLALQARAGWTLLHTPAGDATAWAPAAPPTSPAHPPAATAGAPAAWPTAAPGQPPAAGAGSPAAWPVGAAGPGAPDATAVWPGGLPAQPPATGAGGPAAWPVGAAGPAGTDATEVWPTGGPDQPPAAGGGRRGGDVTAFGQGGIPPRRHRRDG